MVVAMAVVLVMKMPTYQVVRMIAVRNSFMAAAGAVTVIDFVISAGVSGSTFCRIGGTHFQLVFVHMIAVHVVHVAIVKKTLVPIMHDSGVAAVTSMLMRVSLVDFMTHIVGPPL
jgi:hypothetical protein